MRAMEGDGPDLERRKAEYKKGIVSAKCVEKRAGVVRRSVAQKRSELFTRKRANMLPTLEQFEHLEDDLEKTVYLLMAQIRSSENDRGTRDRFIASAKVLSSTQPSLEKWREILEHMIHAGFGQLAVHILGSMSCHGTPVAFDAAWMLANMANVSSDKTQGLFDARVIPSVLRVISSSPQIPLVIQCIKALGNLADCHPHVEIILQHGGMEIILDRLSKTVPGDLLPEELLDLYDQTMKAISNLTYTKEAVKPAYTAVAMALEPSLNMLKMAMAMTDAQAKVALIEESLRAIAGIVMSKGCGEPQTLFIHECQGRAVSVAVTYILSIGHLNKAIWGYSVKYSMVILHNLTILSDGIVLQMLHETGLFASILRYVVGDGGEELRLYGLSVLSNLAACQEPIILNMIRGNEQLMTYLRELYFRTPEAGLRIALIRIATNLILGCPFDHVHALSIGMGCMHIICDGLMVLRHMDSMSILRALQALNAILSVPPIQDICLMFGETGAIDRVDELIYDCGGHEEISSCATTISELFYAAMEDQEFAD